MPNRAWGSSVVHEGYRVCHWALDALRRSLAFSCFASDRFFSRLGVFQVLGSPSQEIHLCPRRQMNIAKSEPGNRLAVKRKCFARLFGLFPEFTQVDEFLSPKLLGKPLLELLRGRSNFAKTRPGKVSAMAVKRDKTATKTLKKSNREQHTGQGGSTLVCAEKMLPGMDTREIVGNRKTLPADFLKRKSKQKKIHI